jgi:putative flippase GtrA
VAPGELPRVQGQDSRSEAFLPWVRSDDAAAQFVRFVTVGGLSSTVYALLFWTLTQEGLGSQPANVVAMILSSVLANDLHWRLTFHADERLSWLSAQAEGGGVSVLGTVITTVALGWLEATSTDAGLPVQLALVGAVTATIGCLRFAALRWLFAERLVSRA